MKDFYSQKEAAELLGVSIDTIRKWKRQKRLEFVKIGNVVRISADAINRMLEAGQSDTQSGGQIVSPEGGAAEPDFVFKDGAHKAAFFKYSELMPRKDEYHISAAYLLGLNADIRAHVHSVFDFVADSINTDTLRESWQTGESLKCTRLLFNLWNGLHDDDIDGSGAEFYTVESIFCGRDAAYYLEAVKIRFALPFSPKG